VLKKYDVSVNVYYALLSLLFPLGYAGFAFASHGPVQSNMV
jgi:hypothetical protein